MASKRRVWRVSFDELKGERFIFTDGDENGVLLRRLRDNNLFEVLVVDDHQFGHPQHVCLVPFQVTQYHMAGKNA